MRMTDCGETRAGTTKNKAPVRARSMESPRTFRMLLKSPFPQNWAASTPLPLTIPNTSRENTKNSGSIGIKESVCRSVKDNGRRVLRSHDFSFLLIFPILSTIPNLLHTFSVHLMNCYFSDFWYSHVTEKRTLRREKCNMRKKQDIIWKQSTRWKLVEKWVTKYLDSYHTLFC